MRTCRYVIVNERILQIHISLKVAFAAISKKLSAMRSADWLRTTAWLSAIRSAGWLLTTAWLSAIRSADWLLTTAWLSAIRSADWLLTVAWLRAIRSAGWLLATAYAPIANRSLGPFPMGVFPSGKFPTDYSQGKFSQLRHLPSGVFPMVTFTNGILPNQEYSQWTFSQYQKMEVYHSNSWKWHNCRREHKRVLLISYGIAQFIDT